MNKIKNFLITSAREILKNENLNITNCDFIENGFDSLNIFELLIKIEDEFNIEIELDEILTHNSLEKLSQLVHEKNKSKNRKAIENFNFDNSNLKLTNIQKAYLYGSKKNIPLNNTEPFIYIEFESNLILEELKYRFIKIINNEILFHYFIKDEELKYNKQLNEENYIDEIISNKKVEDIRNDILKNNFIDTKKLFNITILELKTTRYVFLKFSLINLDAESISIFVNKLKNPNLKISNINKSLYPEYIKIYHDLRATPLFKKQLTNLCCIYKNGIKMPQIPMKKNFLTLKNYKFNRESIFVNIKIYEKLKIIAKNNKITVNSILLTLFSKIININSLNDSFSINLTSNCREKKFRGEIGNFTKNIFIDFDFKNNKNTIDICKLTQSKINKIMENNLCDGIDIARELNKNKRYFAELIPIVFTNLISEHNFNYESINLGTEKFIISQTPQVFMDFQMYIKNENLFFSIDFIDELFDKLFIQCILNNFEQSIKKFIAGEYENDCNR